MADVVRPTDVHQRLPSFTSRNSILTLMVRQFRLAAHNDPFGFGTLTAFCRLRADIGHWCSHGSQENRYRHARDVTQALCRRPIAFHNRCSLRM